MSETSVIDIQINSEEWERFRQSFAEWDKKMQAMPGPWNAINESMVGVSHSQDKLTSHAASQIKAFNDLGKQSKAMGGHFATANNVFKSLGNGVRQMRADVLSITSNLMKWGLMAAGGGLLGTFGMDAAASAVADRTKTAAQAGLNPEVVRKLQIMEHSSFLTPQMLTSIRDSLLDVPRYGATYASLGLNAKRMNEMSNLGPAQNAETILPLLREQFQRYQRGEIKAIPEFVSKAASDLHVGLDVLALGEKQWAQFMGQVHSVAEIDRRTGRDVPLNTSDQKFQEMKLEFQDFGAKMATGPVGDIALKLSKAALTGTENLLKDKSVQEGLEKFLKYLSSPELLKDLKSFSDEIGKAAKVLVDFSNSTDAIANFINGLMPSENMGDLDFKDRLKSFGSRVFGIGSDPAAKPNDRVKKEAKDLDFEGLEKAYQLPAGTLSAIAMVESKGDPRAVSPTGAQGLFQFTKATGEQYGVKDRFDPKQSAVGAAKYLHYLLGFFHGDLKKAVAAYNGGEGAVQRGGVDFKPETANYWRKVLAAMPDLEDSLPANKETHGLLRGIKDAISNLSGRGVNVQVAVQRDGSNISKMLPAPVNPRERR